MFRESALLWLLAWHWAAGPLACAQAADEPAPAAEEAPLPAGETRLLRRALVVPPVGAYGRSPIQRDAIQALLAGGQWQSPAPGGELTLPDGTTATWTPLTADEQGAFQDAVLAGGYACCRVASAVEQVVLLEAVGHAMVYVNGEPRTGDLYMNGYVRLPILLRAGENELLFHVARGALLAGLAPPRAAAQLDAGDLTAPDLLVGQPVQTQLALLVQNATTAPLAGLEIEATLPGGETVATPLPPLLPLGVRKVAVQIVGPPAEAEGEVQAALTLVRTTEGARETLDTVGVPLRVVTPTKAHKRTFVSQIDGSLQYYALLPAVPEEGAEAVRPGLVLTLHGAAVEALGQAQAYANKPDLHLVAPTNRRPFGFDWEDWGRRDALEVLDLALAELDVDPQRVYLTGHSMGGHGTWQVGAHFPDRFAAIGPSAGWVSMWSYAGAVRGDGAQPLEEILFRAAMPSDTLALSGNFALCGVYVLHGELDDNVPVDQARMMKQALETFHPDFAYHEEPGMGHWWGKEGVSGAACVDWPPMFDFFRAHALPAADAAGDVRFVTASPGVSATCRWATIEMQERMLLPSAVELACNAAARRFSGRTDNVARLALRVAHLPPGAPLAVVLDGQELPDLPWPSGDAPTLHFVRTDGRWQDAEAPAPALKGPHRYGPFKEVFANRVLLVYGTHGTPAENAWQLAKARYDAETFWYRGNGAFDVLADDEFLAEPQRTAGRNVVLYGHAQSNAAWPALLAASPVQAEAGRIRVGDEEFLGDDLGCLFVQPRPDDDRALVGAVTGSGLAGWRTLERAPYFVSGVAYPDCLVLSARCLTDGPQGLLAAGYFGEDWSVEQGEFAWAPH